MQTNEQLPPQVPGGPVPGLEQAPPPQVPMGAPGPGENLFDMPQQPGAATGAPIAPGPAPTSPLANMPLPQSGTPTTIPGAIRESAKQTDETTTAAQVNADYEAQTAAEKAKIDSAEAAAMAPSLDHQQKAADAFVGFQQSVTKNYQDTFQKMQLDYASTQKELDSVRAQMHPTDIFGAAGVGRVQGTISMILGAIGGMNDGRNAGVERLDQLAQHRASMLQQEAGLIGKKAGMQENMFNFARQKLGDDQTAYLATYQAQLEAVKAQVQQVSNNFRSPRAQAAARDAIAAINQKLGGVQAQAGQQHSQLAMQGAIAYGQQNLQQATLKLQRDTAPQYQLDGFMGATSKDTHKELSKQVGGARATITLLDGLKDVLEEGVTPDNVRSMMVDQALLIKAAKDYMATGANIDKTERMVIEALSSGKPENLISMFAGVPFTHQVAQMERAKRDIAIGTYMTVRGGNPNVQVDVNDPIWGPIFAKEQADQAARAQRKQGRAAMKQGVPHAGN